MVNSFPLAQGRRGAGACASQPDGALPRRAVGAVPAPAGPARAALFLDDHVVAQVLSALVPAALELSVTAAAQVEARRAEVDRIWRQRLERADFACDRARRQYQLAEPENRLVARQLEREWEAALAERASLGEEYERYRRARPARLSAAELAAIRALAGDIPALWAAPTTTVADRKRLIRAVIESVQVTADGATERVHVAITLGRRPPDPRRPEAPGGPDRPAAVLPGATERIRALAGQGLDNAAIAGQLAAEGFRTGHLHDRFHPGEIQHLIRQLGLRPGLDHDRRTDQGSLGPGQWWLATLAREIGMPGATLFGWLRRGWATGRQDTRPPYRWIITADQADLYEFSLCKTSLPLPGVPVSGSWQRPRRSDCSHGHLRGQAAPLLRRCRRSVRWHRLHVPGPTERVHAPSACAARAAQPVVGPSGSCWSSPLTKSL